MNRSDLPFHEGDFVQTVSIMRETPRLGIVMGVELVYKVAMPDTLRLEEFTEHEIAKVPKEHLHRIWDDAGPPHHGRLGSLTMTDGKVSEIRYDH